MQAKRVSRQARRLQGGMYEAVRIRVERGLSESREKNNDFFRIPIRFKIRNSPQFVTIRRKDSDKPLPPIKRPRALRQPGPRLNLHVSPRGEAKWVRGPSGLGASRAEEKGASRLARAGMLEPYVEHGKQAQRSPGARIRVLRPSGGEKCRLVSPRRPVTASLGEFERHGAAMARHGRHIAPAPVSARRPPFAAKSHKSGQNPGSARENMKHSVHRGSRLPSGAFARHGAAIARHARGGSGGEPVSARVPLWRTPNESMLRKGYVLYCADKQCRLLFTALVRAYNRVVSVELRTRRTRPQ